MSEKLSEKFQKVFTKESNFRNPQRGRNRAKMDKMKVNKEEIQEMIRTQEERKATFPDEDI